MTYGYTVLCLVALGVTVAVERLLRTGVFRSRRYWVTMAIVGVFQLLVDGWLTCRPIVTYAQRHFSGVRLGCPQLALFGADGMPLEDLVFGFAMITQTLMWWLWWGRRELFEQAKSEVAGARGPGRPGGYA